MLDDNAYNNVLLLRYCGYCSGRKNEGLGLSTASMWLLWKKDILRYSATSIYCRLATNSLVD